MEDEANQSPEPEELSKSEIHTQLSSCQGKGNMEAPSELDPLRASQLDVLERIIAIKAKKADADSAREVNKAQGLDGIARDAILASQENETQKNLIALTLAEQFSPISASPSDSKVKNDDPTLGNGKPENCILPSPRGDLLSQQQITDEAFISYSSKDYAIAESIGRFFQLSGLSIWIDQWNIEPSSEWDREIQKGLDRCWCMLLILSPRSVNAKNVMDEVSYALERSIPVFPLLIENCDIPYRLKRIQYTKLQEDVGSSLEELVQKVRSIYYSKNGQ